MEKEPILSHIVAASENNIIGKEGGLPWHLPDDFRFFKDTTWAMPVIMGRKTFVSLKRDLPGRVNIVLTSKTDYHPEGARIVHNLDEALRVAKDADTTEVFIIGGGEIFNETMDVISRIYITRVHTTIDGDTRYPEIDTDKWEKVSEQYHPKDDRHHFDFTFEVWEKK